MKDRGQAGTETVIRASDIGLYVFCARAWRLKADGYESQNRAEMAAGTEAHQAHGAAVATAQRLQRLSLVLLGIAIVLLGLWLVSQ
jgi:hypothetical protein